MFVEDVEIEDKKGEKLVEIVSVTPLSTKDTTTMSP